MMARTKRRLQSLFVVLVIAVGALAVSAAPASAGGPYKWASAQDAYYQSRLTVCAQDLAVRDDWLNPYAYLYGGQTFRVEYVDSEFSSEWVYGFAYGDVNSHGWVQNGWFC